MSTTVEAYVALKLAGDSPTPSTCSVPPRSSASTAVCRTPGSSPGSGWPSSAGPRGTNSRLCRRS
ncbi:hypothetical protein ACU686_18515 [Yinghuangia aomiensis]